MYEPLSEWAANCMSRWVHELQRELDAEYMICKNYEPLSVWIATCMSRRGYELQSVLAAECMNCKVYAPQSVWIAKCRSHSVNGLQSVWAAECINCKVYEPPSVWTSKCMKLGFTVAKDSSATWCRTRTHPSFSTGWTSTRSERSQLTKRGSSQRTGTVVPRAQQFLSAGVKKGYVPKDHKKVFAVSHKVLYLLYYSLERTKHFLMELTSHRWVNLWFTWQFTFESPKMWAFLRFFADCKKSWFNNSNNLDQPSYKVPKRLRSEKNWRKTANCSCQSKGSKGECIAAFFLQPVESFFVVFIEWGAPSGKLDETQMQMIALMQNGLKFFL